MTVAQRTPAAMIAMLAWFALGLAALAGGAWLGSHGQAAAPVEPAVAPAVNVTSELNDQIAVTPPVAVVPDTGGLSVGVIQPGGANIGEPAPDFVLSSLNDGVGVALSDFHGQPVILNFWATWCPPCIREMPLLEAAAQRHAESGLVVLAVDIEESLEEVLTFVTRIGLSLPILMDEDGAVADVYRVGTLPTTYVIDRKGEVRRIKKGAYATEAELEADLATILPE